MVGESRCPYSSCGRIHLTEIAEEGRVPFLEDLLSKVISFNGVGFPRLYSAIIPAGALGCEPRADITYGLKVVPMR